MTPLRYRCGLLKDAWYAVARSEQVGEKPLARVILEEMVVAFRDDTGAAHVLLDRCPHRNAPLSAGKVTGKVLRCSYHGWAFEGNGNCVNIPAQGPGEPTSCRRVESFPVREKAGLVWAWMGGRKSPPDTEPCDMAETKGAPIRSYYMETLFENNVANLVENFMDVPHTIFVHQGWFRSKITKKVPITVERRNDGVLVTYRNESDKIGFTEWILNPKRRPLVHTDEFLMPNNTRVEYIYGARETLFIIASTCTPITDTTTRVFTQIAYKLGKLERLWGALLPWYTRKVISQDVEIARLQGSVVRYYEGTDYHSSEADLPHLFIASLRHWAQEGGAGPKPTPVVKEIDLWL